MKKITSLAALAALIVAASQTSVFGLTVTDLGTTAPTDFTYNQTSQTGSGTPPAKATDGAKTPGQTFTLSSLSGVTGSGYPDRLELTGIYFKGNVAADVGATTWTLNFGTVDGSGNFTSLLSSPETASTTETIGKKDYIQLTLSDYVELNANIKYAFFIATDTPYGVSGTDNPAFSSGISGESASLKNGVVVEGAGVSRVFGLDTVPVPEPVNWAFIPVLGAVAFFAIRRFRSLLA